MTTIAELERALQRYGDDLYRLALLLTPDESSAAQALTSAVRRLINTAADSIDEQALIAALIAALPPERRQLRRRLPAWARPSAPQGTSGPTLAALAQLPRSQRLALGLTMLRGFDHEQAAPLVDEDATRSYTLVRDALLTLAPHATPERAPTDLDVEHAPAACQPTRAALALGTAQVHNDPALRGHLALCPACREIEHAWLHLSTTVENALRGALRDVFLPDSLSARLRETLTPEPANAKRQTPFDLRLRLGLLALLVIALITLVVLPRRPAANNATTGTAGISATPRELVRRARAQLYAPPAGSGVWHGQWEIRWNFVHGGYAILNADQWIDTVAKRHRMQLVHQSGGGPYEFELGDGGRELWYAASSNYSPSLYPIIAESSPAGAHFQLNTDQQQEMLRTRLQSGAWNLADAYLRQALSAPELRSWGRQQAADGTQLELIGFRGTSPLALPPDAPEATASSATILLTVDSASGTLREVRELIGGEGREQTGRMTWRFVSGEWITDALAITRTFTMGQAWNGVGEFVEQQGIVDPALPLVPPSTLVPLAHAVQYSDISWMTARAPAGAARAVMVMLDNSTANNAIIYFGEGRRMIVSTQRGSGQLLSDASEQITLNGRSFRLQAGVAQSYAVTTSQQIPGGTELLVTRIGALGYTRAEILDVLRAFGPATVEAYAAQARIFTDSQQDPAAFDALVKALAPALPLDGAARHVLETVYTRHDGITDPLPDPYHLPPYLGWPERLTSEFWSRGAVLSGTFEIAHKLYDDHTIYTQGYTDSEQTWYYDGKQSMLSHIPHETPALFDQIDQDQSTILDLLACGKNSIATLPDGAKVISSSVMLDETASPALDSCRNWRYNSLVQEQRANSSTAEAPYLLDVADQPITTWILLGADGRLASIEVRAGTNPDGTLLESRKIVRDEHVAANQVPADAFTKTAPNAISVYEQTNVISPRSLAGNPPLTVTLTDALALAQTPLLRLPPAADVWLVVEIGSPKEITWPPYYSAESPFDSAFRRGLATRLTYALPPDQLDQPLHIYEGRAERFGAYLRTIPLPWSESAPTTLTIAGQTIDAWQVTLPDGARWKLAEIDGTLIAIEATTPGQENMATKLERLK